MIRDAASRSKEKERLQGRHLVLFVFVFRRLTILPLVVHNNILLFDPDAVLRIVDLRGSLRPLWRRMERRLHDHFPLRRSQD